MTATDDRGAPDGGWSWVVLVSGFVIYMINDGIDNSSGLLAAEIIKSMNTTRQSVGWIVALKCASMSFICPLSAYLCHCVDIRIVGSAAGLLSFLAFLAASFATKPWHLFVTIGLVSGPGAGTSLFITTICICLYFNKLRATAAGIALCGSGLGGLVFSPLVYWMLRAYGWQGCFMLLSALYLNIVPCAMLFRPLEAAQPSPPPGSTPSPLPPQSQKPAIAEGEKPASEVQAGSSPAQPEVVVVWSQPQDTHNTDVITAASVTSARTAEATRRRWLATTAWLGDCLLLLPVVPWPTAESQLIGGSGGNNEATVKDAANDGDSADFCQRFRQCRCRNPRLLAFHASRLILASAVPTITVYIADRCHQMGLTAGETAGLISVLSGFSMLGRLGFGCLGDWDSVPALVLYGAVLVAGGGFVAASLAARSFGALSAFMGISSFFTGGAISLTTKVSVQLDGTGRLFYVFARQSIFQGVGVLMGPPVGGAIYDCFDSYNATFAFISVLLAVSGLMVIIIYWTTVRESGWCGRGTAV